MKRIKVTALVSDSFEEKDVRNALHLVAKEVEKYEERRLPKDVDVMDEYSFESLMEAVKDLANNIWGAGKAFFKVSAWAVVVIVSGIRFLWKGLNDLEKKKKNGKKEVTSKVSKG